MTDDVAGGDRGEEVGLGAQGAGASPARDTGGNGSGAAPKSQPLAVIYARVSTTEQATHGYSIEGQLSALRRACRERGCAILEEVADKGHSGRSLNRPGIDRLRELIATCDVSIVLSQDRDRIAREPLDSQLLRQELRQHGCDLQSLNDRGDASPEDVFSDHILDVVAKYERSKMAERTRRGRERKAKEGKIMRGPKSPYGFRHDDSGDGLVIYDAEARNLRKIFELAASGCGTNSIQAYLFEQGILSPTGKPSWARPVLTYLLLNDLYKSHSTDELKNLLEPHVLARLDGNCTYGVWFYGQNKIEKETRVEYDANGLRKYRTHTTKTPRPRDEWIAVPVPSILDRKTWDHARALIAANSGVKTRMDSPRVWALRGLIRCSCGSPMTTRIVNYRKTDGVLKHYYYYACSYQNSNYPGRRCAQRVLSAPIAEGLVRDFVMETLGDPAKLESRIGKLLDEDSDADDDKLVAEMDELSGELKEIDSTRFRYQKLAALGHMTVEELSLHLEGLEGQRVRAIEKLTRLRERAAKRNHVEADRAVLLERTAALAKTNLASLEPEDLRTVYGMLKLQISPSEDGLDLEGVFCDLEGTWSDT